MFFPICLVTFWRTDQISVSCIQSDELVGRILCSPVVDIFTARTAEQLRLKVPNTTVTARTRCTLFFLEGDLPLLHLIKPLRPSQCKEHRVILSKWEEHKTFKDVSWYSFGVLLAELDGKRCVSLLNQSECRWRSSR